ncbi:MFS transporter [Nonomuraea sp. NPDC049784]|uniref:MFS transporter n=1 Tax=Nonomuraea sp. NPDC049784 TaxID=3154361 RepID=UPI0033D2D2C1
MTSALWRNHDFLRFWFGETLSLLGTGVIIVSLRQTVTPPSMMGRMTALFRTLLFGGGALGGLSAGLLAGAIGAHAALTIAAAASAAVIIGLFASPVSRLRELLSPTPDQTDPQPSKRSALT